jgi:hypothetical protein
MKYTHLLILCLAPLLSSGQNFTLDDFNQKYKIDSAKFRVIPIFSSIPFDTLNIYANNRSLKRSKKKLSTYVLLDSGNIYRWCKYSRKEKVIKTYAEGNLTVAEYYKNGVILSLDSFFAESKITYKWNKNGELSTRSTHDYRRNTYLQELFSYDWLGRRYLDKRYLLDLKNNKAIYSCFYLKYYGLYKISVTGFDGAIKGEFWIDQKGEYWHTVLWNVELDVNLSDNQKKEKLVLILKDEYARIVGGNITLNELIGNYNSNRMPIYVYFNFSTRPNL